MRSRKAVIRTHDRVVKIVRKRRARVIRAHDFVFIRKIRRAP
jgi:hypothetical protein